MPSDAKLGLLCGVAIVVTVSAIFFRNEATHALVAPESAPAAVGASKIMPPANSPGADRRLKSKATNAVDHTVSSTVAENYGHELTSSSNAQTPGADSAKPAALDSIGLRKEPPSPGEGGAALPSLRQPVFGQERPGDGIRGQNNPPQKNDH
jgi:hypothetical protein